MLVNVIRTYFTLETTVYLAKKSINLLINMNTTELIARDFALENPEREMTEEELLQLLSDVIAHMIERKLDFLLSLLYRLDVEEHKINIALAPTSNEPANVALARLVLERQKQRVFTKQFYKQQNEEDLGDLAW